MTIKSHETACPVLSSACDKLRRGTRNRKATVVAATFMTAAISISFISRAVAFATTNEYLFGSTGRSRRNLMSDSKKCAVSEEKDKDFPKKLHNNQSRNNNAIATKHATPSAKKKLNPKKTQSLPQTTESFDPIWFKHYTPTGQNPVPVHTLLLGTHPSITSLDRQQYFGHDQNAFWWIAGDCLGFRRGSAVSTSTGKAYKLAQHLRYPPDQILAYDQQVEILTQYGFALWDIVGSCQRSGSLDQDIRNEQPNDVRQFCQQHNASLKRIVMCNGGTGSKMFLKHFRDWLESGELKPLEKHEASQKSFGPAILRGERKRKKEEEKSIPTASQNKIVLISALSVSPAAAKFSYIEKRKFWEDNIYKSGLEDYRSDLEAVG
mmetsp:Transcript_10333/g.15188  ORF Transcript_10333/g.15188 Transcript_10333/m.15188 type:complete len:378 (+) Transcript_10333:778-1911(+)